MGSRAIGSGSHRAKKRIWMAATASVVTALVGGALVFAVAGEQQNPRLLLHEQMPSVRSQ